MERKAWHYVAGIIDAEGCVCITGGHYTKLRFVIGNTDVRLMRWLVRNFGGTFSKTQRCSARLGEHQYYGWSIWGQKKAEFFRRVLPFVMLKRRQLEIALEYIGLEEKSSVEKRLEFKKQVNELNDSYAVISSVKEKRDAAKYTAGFIDGDGTIFISPKTGRPDVGISSRSSVLVDWFIQNFGGKRVDSHTPMGREFFLWKLYDYTSRENFLLRILPYLLLKHEQAKLALSAVRLGGAMETLACRQELGRKCVMLNHGRSSVTTDTREGKVCLRHSLNFAGDRESEPAETPVS